MSALKWKKSALRSFSSEGTGENGACYLLSRLTRHCRPCSRGSILAACSPRMPVSLV